MRKSITALAAAAVVGAGIAVAGCTTSTPALSECGAVTNGGFGSSGQGITALTHPGGKVSVGRGETPWYWPCNERNFVTSATGPADRTTGLAVRTQGSGSTPGMPVDISSAVYFTANQNEAVMRQFLPFMLKYGAASNDPQTDSSVSGSAHSSTPGWENMLDENMGPAVDRASQLAAQKFGPGLWLDQTQWNTLGDDIAANLDAQLRKETGTTVPFFCGADSTETACTPITVVVSDVTPHDPAVVTAYNKEVAAEQSQAANAARVAQAKLLYGPDWYYALMLQDEAAQCPKCSVYVGAPPAAVTGGK